VFVMVLNYIPFIGPALMMLIVFAVGQITYSAPWMGVLPPAVVLLLHLAESQFITPMVIGRRMALNPLLVLLSLAFWLWLWGPLGGFIAVPLLLAFRTALHHLLPRHEAAAQRYGRGSLSHPLRFRSGPAKISVRQAAPEAVLATSITVAPPQAPGPAAATGGPALG
jgi:hypothetical protein